MSDSDALWEARCSSREKFQTKLEQWYSIRLEGKWG